MTVGDEIGEHGAVLESLEEYATVAIALTIHLDTEDGRLEVPIRWTVVMIRRGDAWRWLHRHASSAATSQDAGAAYPSAR